MIIVCGLAKAQELIDMHEAKFVIGILGPETAHPTYRGIAPKQHLRLSFNDINAPADGMTAATSGDALRMINFVETWDRKAPLLIHCWAGVSRSTASAFSALCMLRPSESEMELAKRLRAASPSATPNRLITQMVDDALGRKGRMVAAIESIGRGADAFEGKPFVLEV